MALVKRSAMFEYPLAKLVDFAIYLLCLCSFSWLLANLRRAYRDKTEQRPADVAAKQNILQVLALARAGVEVAVASNLPPPALANGWHMANFSHWGSSG